MTFVERTARVREPRGPYQYHGCQIKYQRVADGDGKRHERDRKRSRWSGREPGCARGRRAAQGARDQDANKVRAPQGNGAVSPATRRGIFAARPACALRNPRPQRHSPYRSLLLPGEDGGAFRRLRAGWPLFSFYLRQTNTLKPKAGNNVNVINGSSKAAGEDPRKPSEKTATFPPKLCLFACVYKRSGVHSLAKVTAPFLIDQEAIEQARRASARPGPCVCWCWCGSVVAS